MAKKIVVVSQALKDRHYEKIQSLAGRYGYSVERFEHARDALEAVRDAEIVYGFGTSLAKAAVEAKWICTSSAGVDPYMAPGIFSSDEVLFTNSAGAYGVTISEHIVMTALELMRRQMEYRKIVEKHEWFRALPVRSICGSRVTILGTGDIGRHAAKRMRGFDPASITGVSRSGKADAMLFDRALPQTRVDEILPETDLLVMALPGTKETVRFIDARRLALLPETAYLVNVGRGSSLDQNALCDCLRAGKLAGAALDVFETEPIPPEDPIWDCPNLLITPHVAGNMTLGYTLEKTFEMFYEDLDNYLNGRPLHHLVNRKLGY